MTDNRYIEGLPPEQRPVAKVWADMPAPEFQARVGLTIEEIREEVAAIRRPAWKTGAQWVGVAAASAIATVFGAGQVQR